MIKNLSAFVSSMKLGREIENVLVCPDKIVATDSFKLIEVLGETGAADSFTVKLPKGLKTFDRVQKTDKGADVLHKGAIYSVEVGDAELYPKYEAIIPTDKPVYTVTLSPAHLAAICEAYKDCPSFTLSMYGANKPVVFTEDKEKVRALLMAILK